jgi:hypothetical protein
MDVLNVKCKCRVSKRRKTQRLSARVWHDATLAYAIRIKEKIEPLAFDAVGMAV